MSIRSELMRDALVEDILAASGTPVEDQGLSVEEMETAVREGRVLEIYYWSQFAEGEASYGFADSFGVDSDGKVVSRYMVFPRPIPLHLRKSNAFNWDKPADVIAAFGIKPGATGSSSPEVSRSEHDYERIRKCGICSQLLDHAYGFQKIAREEGNTFLPAASERLEVVKDLKPNKIRLPKAVAEGGTPEFLEIPSSRLLQLKRCPECGTSYLYRTDYEFLPMAGSEDEQELTRLTDAQACLAGSTPESAPTAEA